MIHSAHLSPDLRSSFYPPILGFASSKEPLQSAVALGSTHAGPALH